MKSLLLILLLCCASLTQVQAQTQTGKDFERFASRQDSLFVNAYRQRDIDSYQSLLKEFLARYNSLDSAAQKKYSGYLTGAYYNLCCTYSLLNNKPMALATLEKAIKAGYDHYAHMGEDSDLNNIRNEEKYKSLLAPLRATHDYRYVLGRGEAYNTAENRPLPAFTYQSAANPHLAELRKAFNLDSIAGKGNEVSRFINLLHWIHNLIPHDGNHENPVVKNAMSLIANCKRDNRGLNCRGLATVLNECYLSLGYKSRMVTCLPKDSLHTDPDCHVIVMVYSNTWKKWLWIDPTNDAYVMNEKGELLSIEEVRYRIIHDLPLIVNPDANWNHRESETKENYLYYYMAKNLYMLECAASSEYDLETWEEGKRIDYIRLLPLDYFRQTPVVKETNYPKTKTTLVVNYTNNPAIFWQKP